MKRILLATVVVILSVVALGGAAFAQPAPEFKLGFKDLADQIPDVVGQPVENEHHNPVNGDSLQQTDTGLMVWRKADNWTAFTDGSTTWINGPYGVESRSNLERFSWEPWEPGTTRLPPPGPTRRDAPAWDAVQWELLRIHEEAWSKVLPYVEGEEFQLFLTTTSGLSSAFAACYERGTPDAICSCFGELDIQAVDTWVQLDFLQPLKFAETEAIDFVSSETGALVNRIGGWRLEGQISFEERERLNRSVGDFLTRETEFLRLFSEQFEKNWNGQKQGYEVAKAGCQHRQQ